MSSTTMSSFTSHQLGNLHLGNDRRTQCSIFRPCDVSKIFASRNDLSAKQKLSYFNGINPRQGAKSTTIRMDLNAIGNINSGAPGPSGFPLPGWSNWMLLTILPMILPFVKSKWGPLILIKSKVDTTIEMVENVAETVEEVAKKVDQVADEVAEKLPEGSMLRETISMVDEVAEEAIKGSDLVEELVNKVEEAEKRVETLLEKPTTVQAEMASEVKNQVNTLIEKPTIVQVEFASEVEKQAKTLIEKPTMVQVVEVTPKGPSA